MDVSQSSTRNLLLRALRDDDYALIEPGLVRIALPPRFQLHEAGRTIEQVYFPEDGLVSIVAIGLDGKSSEVGLFGREGMSETATVLGTDNAPYEAYVQIIGASCLRLPVAVLNEAFEASPTLRRSLLRYAQAMMIQLSSSITAAGQTIEQRLARWLLMCHDRVDGDAVMLTHEFVAMMLNIRRAGVTTALQTLSDQTLVATSRNSIEILDRDGLEALAEGGYGLAESEYTRLIGAPLRKTAMNPTPH